jgi:hypothetical protein
VSVPLLMNVLELTVSVEWPPMSPRTTTPVPAGTVAKMELGAAHDASDVLHDERPARPAAPELQRLRRR